MAKKNKNKDVGGENNNVVHEVEHHENNNDNNKKNKSDDSNSRTNTIVLKVDLHCEGCANKLLKIICSSQGVEGVKCEWGASKISVVGNVDPLKLQEKIEERTNKKVEVISPLPKKEKKPKEKDNDKDSEDTNKKSKDSKKPKEEDNNKDSEDSNKKSKDSKKPKELPVTTAMLKVHLHCQGCIQKIHKIVTKTKGYKEMKIDKQKDLVTVTGAMEMKSLGENLKKRLKRNVEIVPAKIDGEKKATGDKKSTDDKKDGGSEKKKGGGGKGEKAAANGGGKQGHKMQMHVPYGLPYPPPSFNTYSPGFYGGEQVQQQQQQEAVQQFHHAQYTYGPSVYAPQIFSDENPNACSVM